MHDRGEGQSWTCVNCGADVDRAFDLCWNCGADGDGRVDPDFKSDLDPAPLRPVVLPTRAEKWRRSALTLSVVSFGVLFVALLTGHVMDLLETGWVYLLLGPPLCVAGGSAVAFIVLSFQPLEALYTEQEVREMEQTGVEIDSGRRIDDASETRESA